MFIVWFYFNRKINYVYLFIVFIFYYRLEKIDVFVMKFEVVIIYQVFIIKMCDFIICMYIIDVRYRK